MSETIVPPDPPVTPRLEFSRFTDSDVESLALVLSDPEVSRSLTAKATTPEQCRACAAKRIAWHNSAWETHGYGVWALRDRKATVASQNGILGWCGFGEPDVGSDPEILYGLSRAHWGIGLATEAAHGAIKWLFDNRIADGVSAIIFARLNPGSIGVTKKLGMTRRGTMSFAGFLPDPDLACDVLDYEIWRLRDGTCMDLSDLLFQAPYKAGQIVSLGVANRGETEDTLRTAALERPDCQTLDPATVTTRVQESFRLGLSETTMDWYHVTCDVWQNER